MPKKNGKTRICGDFRVTVNKRIQVNKYPLPKVEDIFSMLGGGGGEAWYLAKLTWVMPICSWKSKELCPITPLRACTVIIDCLLG